MAATADTNEARPREMILRSAHRESGGMGSTSHDVQSGNKLVGEVLMVNTLRLTSWTRAYRLTGGGVVATMESRLPWERSCG